MLALSAERAVQSAFAIARSYFAQFPVSFLPTHSEFLYHHISHRLDKPCIGFAKQGTASLVF
jgi:hypothetical protein